MITIFLDGARGIDKYADELKLYPGSGEEVAQFYVSTQMNCGTTVQIESVEWQTDAESRRMTFAVKDMFIMFTRKFTRRKTIKNVTEKLKFERNLLS